MRMVCLSLIVTNGGPLKGTQESQEHWNEFSQGSRPVADCLFDDPVHVSECFVVFADHEDGVVAKSASSLARGDNPPMAIILGSE